MPFSNLIARQLGRAAPQIISLDFIIKEIAKRMLERLNYIKISPHSVLDIGSGLGIDSDGLQLHYPKANIYRLDFVLNILKQSSSRHGLFSKKYKNVICADALNLPFASQSMDLVWSNMALPYIVDFKQYFGEINRILKLGGTFLVSGLGVDSLLQLRHLGLATNNFPDMHLIGDILVELGFNNPVTDVEYINLQYDNLDDLLFDIRIIGAGAWLKHRLNRSEYMNMQAKFNELSQGGKLPLTLEVFYAHGWKDRLRRDLVSGRSVIEFYPK